MAVPIFYNSCWAYNWKLERKVWKEDLINERTNKLKQKVESVALEDIPLGKLTKEEFD